MQPELVVLNPTKAASKRLVGRTIVTANLDARPQRLIFDDGLELLIVGVKRDEDGNALEIQLQMPPDDVSVN